MKDMMNKFKKLSKKKKLLVSTVSACVAITIVAGATYFLLDNVFDNGSKIAEVTKKKDSPSNVAKKETTKKEDANKEENVVSNDVTKKEDPSTANAGSETNKEVNKDSTNTGSTESIGGSTGGNTNAPANKPAPQPTPTPTPPPAPEPTPEPTPPANVCPVSGVAYEENDGVHYAKAFYSYEEAIAFGDASGNRYMYTGKEFPRYYNGCPVWEVYWPI